MDGDKNHFISNSKVLTALYRDRIPFPVCCWEKVKKGGGEVFF